MADLTPNPVDFEENVKLRCKVEKISSRIVEAFDADGIDDIRIPKKVSIWWVILNIASVGKLISDVINIVKNECEDVVVVIDTTPKTENSDDDQVPETASKANS